MAKKHKKREGMFAVLFCGVLGILLAWITSDMKGIPWAYGILKNTGLWIFIASVTAYFGKSKLSGGLSAAALGIGRFLGTFFRGLVLHQSISSGMPIYELLFCVILGLIGVLAYSCHEDGWIGALCGSIPVSFILAEGYPAIYSRSVALIFDIVVAVFLYFIVLKGVKRRSIAIPFVALFTFLLIHFEVLSQMAGVYL